MDVFSTCQAINESLELGNEQHARDLLIRVLDFQDRNGESYSLLVNHLIRQTGLYPYLKPESSSWSDRFVYETFKVDIGATAPVTLHREQSLLLSRLIAGDDLAVSAPTSFGKSFVIDSFISIRKPRNVVIIVPTIALTDETRRRLQKKFSPRYKIITTADVELAEKNIFIFPQERALSYLEVLTEIDMLVVDEFYKASAKFDKERAPALLRTILKLSAIAKQRYFLAPNISRLNDSPFTKNMTFVELDFNTVYLDKHELYQEINGDEQKKSEALLNILEATTEKSLIYAGTYSSIESLATLLVTRLPRLQNVLLENFADWLSKNYGSNWHLTSLIRRGVGIHTGQLHRAISQIQVRLFEEENGLKNLVSTSSIVEGVNTSAKNVVIWKSKNGGSKLTDFTYRNIIGRGGRMLKHFVGEIYVLDKPPDPTQTDLDLVFPDSLLSEMDTPSIQQALTPQQVAKVIAYKEEMHHLIGKDAFEGAIGANAFQSSDSGLIKTIAQSMKSSPGDWNGLAFLNSQNSAEWDRMLYKLIGLAPGGWDIQYSKFVGFIKALSKNWDSTIPDLLNELDNLDIGVNDFFKLERNATFKLASLAADVNTVHGLMFKDSPDISPFVSRLSSAFLPPVVYELEEYGLPRMLSRKIHRSGLVDLVNPERKLHQTLDELRVLGSTIIVLKVPDLDAFDKYLLAHFLDGIQADGVGG